MSAESELIRVLQQHNSLPSEKLSHWEKKTIIMCLENEYNRTGQEAVHKLGDKI